ncbi:tetratricopeptide repeat-containing hybrid sensor histidine kinase/response regulator [Aquimarina sp. 2201CG14-23]|uniref:tetratricopeptide repeat-containing hybrid sensor histidine kinase/response regulator n=1 Tax=Aquimarina mycalae TaxID=3040073 RepID=UPI0024780253|nr:response regulator [Aquimarina sp. 2201CG14-23]MDH7446788.1 response regulator [Aquimarina sp. 2201CG14-23]
MKNFIRDIIVLLLVTMAVSVKAQSDLEEESIESLIEDAKVLLEDYKYDQALKKARTAFKTAQFNNDDRSLAKIFHMYAQVHELNKQEGEAIKNYRTAVTFASRSKTIHLKAKLYNNLGNLYVKTDSTIGKGLEYYEDAYIYAKTVKDTTKMVKPLLNLADYYISNKDYKTCYEKLTKVRALIGDEMNIPNTEKTKLSNLLGKYFLRVRNYDRANEHIEDAISFAKEEIKNTSGNSKSVISRYHIELSTSYLTRYKVFKAQKEFESAIPYLEKHYQSISRSEDLIKEIELQKTIVEYDVANYKDKAKQATEVIDKNFSKEIKWQISIILGVVLILISLAFLISAYKNNLQKKKLNNDLIEKNKELVNAKETAEQVSTLKSQFISTVSHELRTPLYGVIGLTSLLMEHPEEKKKNEYLESLKFSGDYLLALINDVLQLSKIETNEVKLEKVSFDLRSLIEGIVNSLHSKQKHNNNNSVHIDIDRNIKTTLLGDSVRLSQILINLVGNALKFTNNGNIWIKVKCLEYQDDNYKLRFIIKDDGIGIPKSKQATIFDNFAQVKNQNQEYEGTGLGLAIVKKLIHLHNSEIIIDSEEGVGSEFTFDLYYEKAIKEQDLSSNRGETISIGTTNFNILIVDDNKINQIVTQNILKKKGYTCDLANNGMDAIEMIKKESFDLVLMDINMPEMNGLDATTVIRTFNTHIPIIALTAVEEGEIRDQALSVGMNDVIIKPYDTQQFFQTIMKNISKVKYIN